MLTVAILLFEDSHMIFLADAPSGEKLMLSFLVFPTVTFNGFGVNVALFGSIYATLTTHVLGGPITGSKVMVALPDATAFIFAVQLVDPVELLTETISSSLDYHVILGLPEIEETPGNDAFIVPVCPIDKDISDLSSTASLLLNVTVYEATEVPD